MVKITQCTGAKSRNHFVSIIMASMCRTLISILMKLFFNISMWLNVTVRPVIAWCLDRYLSTVPKKDLQFVSDSVVQKDKKIDLKLFSFLFQNFSSWNVKSFCEYFIERLYENLESETSQKMAPENGSKNIKSIIWKGNDNERFQINLGFIFDFSDFYSIQKENEQAAAQYSILALVKDLLQSIYIEIHSFILYLLASKRKTKQKTSYMRRTSRDERER